MFLFCSSSPFRLTSRRLTSTNVFMTLKLFPPFPTVRRFRPSTIPRLQITKHSHHQILVEPFLIPKISLRQIPISPAGSLLQFPNHLHRHRFSRQLRLYRHPLPPHFHPFRHRRQTIASSPGHTLLRQRYKISSVWFIGPRNSSPGSSCH